jgi:multiple sugar transport system ATP-binding protein
MIYVTHDQVEAMTLADRIVVMHGGIVEQVGRPLDLYNRPASLFVAGFIGSPTMNFIDGTIAARVNAATIGVRPEHLAVAKEGAWTGTVSHAEHLGADTMLYVDVPEIGMLTARILGDINHDVGDRVGLTPQDGKVYRFDAEQRAIAA